MTAFAALPLSAIANPDLGLTDFRVLASLASFAAPSKPVAWPSRASIGQRAGITSLSLISKTLHKLQDLGLIEIRQTGRTNLYRILQGPQMPTDAPEQTCTPDCTSAVHPVVHANQTIEQTTQDPLTPTPEAVTQAATETAIGEAIAMPEAVEQPESAVEEDGQGEQAAPTEHPEATEQPDSTPKAKPKVDPETTEQLESVQAQEQHQDAQKPTEAAQTRSERITAARRIVERLNQITGLQLPTGDDKGIAVRRAARALNRYTEQEIQAVILAYALGFHHPASILKSSVLEPLISEQRKRKHQEQKRIKAEQEALQAIKQASRPQANRDVGRAHLNALKRLLGPSEKPLCEVMRA